MEMEYFIIFGSILSVIASLAFIIFRLTTKISDLSYELKLGKINCQKDLERLEERINRFTSTSNSDVNHSKDIEKLDKLIKQLNKLVDTQIDNADTTKRLLND
jgi:predicted RNase H-like nuclease (RuvC/YqgF family)